MISFFLDMEYTINTGQVTITMTDNMTRGVGLAQHANH